MVATFLSATCEEFSVTLLEHGAPPNVGIREGATRIPWTTVRQPGAIGTEKRRHIQDCEMRTHLRVRGMLCRVTCTCAHSEHCLNTARTLSEHCLVIEVFNHCIVPMLEILTILVSNLYESY